MAKLALADAVIRAALQGRWGDVSACYQLRIGLQELYDSAIGQTSVDIAWLTARCKHLIDQAGS
jgi:hypothetical protein